MAREIVNLEQAWFWLCPRCGRDNYARSLAAESMDGVPDETIREMLGLEDWEELPDDVAGEFVTAPMVVQCAHCHTEFPCFVEDEDAGDVPDPPEIPDCLPEDFGVPPG